jgi:muconate cycloisomerase
LICVAVSLELKKMHIVELTSYLVRMPLRGEVKHASHARRVSDNIVVSCHLADGTIGWGEGVPRTYVTGESPEEAMAQMEATPWGEQLRNDCGSWQDVLELCDRIHPSVSGDDPRRCRSNSVRCAVELSVLDAFARLFGDPLSAVTAHLGAAEPIRSVILRVRYSGGVTAASPRKELISALKMRLFGFAQCKVKVGIPSIDDAPRLQRIRRWLGRRMDVRLDANEAWQAEEVVSKIEPLLACRISAVEQPVPHEQVSGLTHVRRQVPVPIMLDESLTSLVDAETAVRQGTCDLFNIRLSKCGGFLQSLRLAARAHEAGLGYQLGCHPGESGILSAAGRHFASSVRDIRYCEGSYDRFLLRDNLINEKITFGYGGRAPALEGPGLGITIDRQALLRLTRNQQRHALT